MRRVYLILIIVAVLGVLVGGVVWYLHRNTAEKLLARSELALRAKQFDRALELADAAIAKDPANWRGYYDQALAYSSLQRYDEARASLGKAAEHDPPGVTVDLAVADTYAMPGRRTLASLESSRQPSALKEAIGQLRQANVHLAKVQAKDEEGRLDVQQALAQNLVQTGLAQQTLEERLKTEAQREEAAGNAAAHEANLKASGEAKAESDKCLDEASRILLDVLKRDAKRDAAARLLVEVAVKRKDQKALAAARQVILAQEDPPPQAAMMLIMQELASLESLGKAEGSKKLAAAAQQLDQILAKHPKDLEVKLARAEVALRLADWPKAQALCKEVLDAKPGQDQQVHARFIDANALTGQDKRAEAERELAALKTQVPESAAVQYAYALAAMAAGKKELAREAMRTVTRLDPDHAGARRYLAESLLADGFASEAFADAKAYYDKHPDEPAALGLFVRAAKARDQEALAEQAILKALEKCDPELHKLLAGLPKGESPDAGKLTELKSSPGRPDLMLAASAGYDELGDRAKALAVRRRAAECKPGTVEENLAVAEALAGIGRAPEAEKKLRDERARDPEDPRFALGLARLYDATGRNLQAIEEYRAAVGLDPRSAFYREGLARALFNGGLLDACLAECQTILSRDPANVVALGLDNRVKSIRGEEVLRTEGTGTPTGLPLAQTYLNNGQPQKCVEVCLEELRKTPTSADARSLLGLAYSALGQNDKSIEQWTAVLKDNPAQFEPYLQLADALSKSMKPEDVSAALGAIPGAKPDVIGLAMGWLHNRAGDYKAAAEAYDRVLKHWNVPDDRPNDIRLLRVQALFRAGQKDQAIDELDRLAKLAQEPAWRGEVLYAKAALLVAADRAAEADQVLAGLEQQAVKDKKDGMLERVISLYMDMKQTDKALAACERLERLLPDDPRPYITRASVLLATDKPSEASDELRKAVEKQPGNYRIHLALARALDADGKPIPAIDALKQLETQGQAARSMALFELGDMLARWGLAGQAAETYEQLAKRGYEGDPRLQLALGQAFARLGKKDRAREVLGKVPVYAPQYVPATQILADLEDKEEGKLKILRQVEKAKPGQPSVLVQEMGILLVANRPADAVKAFQDFVAARAPGSAVPEQARFLAMQAMLGTNDMRAAADVAAQAARETRAPRWRQLAALVALDGDPGAAKGFLPAVSEAGPGEAMLGLVLASRTGQDVAPWKGRLEQVQKNLSALKPPLSIPPGERLLAAVVAGARTEAASELATWPPGAAVGRKAAVEFLASAAQNPQASAEAGELLKASLAMDLGIPVLARTLSMRSLKARPTCQWAAAIALQTGPEVAFLREVLGTLQPADCLLAQAIRARLAVEEKQYENAVAIWRAAADADKGSPETSLQLGIALERSGRLEEALGLYRKVWEASQSPVAGNNAAYLVSQLYPQDAAKLAEAGKWMAEVVKAAPGVPPFHDTLGWIQHLQGRDEDASRELRRAVKGLPDSPEAHYHLGEVEAAVGRTDLARWHLAAAVSIGDRLKAEKGELPTSASQAIRLARERLAKLEQPKS